MGTGMDSIYGPGGTALFLVPKDTMGGAEGVTRLLARTAARSRLFDRVEVLSLTARRTGALDELAANGVICRYGPLARERGALAWLPAAVVGRRYTFAFSSAAQANAALSALRRVRLLQADRLVSRESTTISEYRYANGRKLRPLYRAYGGQDLMICQTDHMAGALNAFTKGRFSNRIAVFANPVDTERAEAGRAIATPPQVDATRRGRKRIVWCGRLEPRKAPVLAVEALAQAVAEGLDAELVMVGDGGEREAVRAAAAARGVSDRLTLTGFVANPTGIMAACDIGFLSSDLEGFPNVVLEMMASGIHRVVATDCADALAAVPAVRVVPRQDAAAAARALVRMAAEPVSAERRQTVSNYLRTRSADAFLRRAVFGVGS